MDIKLVFRHLVLGLAGRVAEKTPHCYALEEATPVKQFSVVVFAYFRGYQ